MTRIGCKVRRLTLWLGLVAGLATASGGFLLAVYHWWASSMPFRPEVDLRLAKSYALVGSVASAVVAVLVRRIFFVPPKVGGP